MISVTGQLRSIFTTQPHPTRTQDEAPDLQQELQDLVTKTLVEDGLDVVVTSRPSGIADASQYVDKFVIMNLLPLTSEQQRRIIEVQMEGDEFFDSVLAVRCGDRKRN